MGSTAAQSASAELAMQSASEGRSTAPCTVTRPLTESRLDWLSTLAAVRTMSPACELTGLCTVRAPVTSTLMGPLPSEVMPSSGPTMPMTSGVSLPR